MRLEILNNVLFEVIYDDMDMEEKYIPIEDPEYFEGDVCEDGTVITLKLIQSLNNEKYIEDFVF